MWRQGTPSRPAGPALARETIRRPFSPIGIVTSTATETSTTSPRTRHRTTRAPDPPAISLALAQATPRPSATRAAPASAAMSAAASPRCRAPRTPPTRTAETPTTQTTTANPTTKTVPAPRSPPNPLPRRPKPAPHPAQNLIRSPKLRPLDRPPTKTPPTSKTPTPRSPAAHRPPLLRSATTPHCSSPPTSSAPPSQRWGRIGLGSDAAAPTRPTPPPATQNTDGSSRWACGRAPRLARYRGHPGATGTTRDRRAAQPATTRGPSEGRPGGGLGSRGGLGGGVSRWWAVWGHGVVVGGTPGSVSAAVWAWTVMAGKPIAAAGATGAATSTRTTAPSRWT